MARKKKLTDEQRVEIAMLMNSGVDRETLARDYDVSVHTISLYGGRIKNREKHVEVIARTREEMFRYAQSLYVSPETPSRVKGVLGREFFVPIVRDVEEAVRHGWRQTPVGKLLLVIFGEPLKRNVWYEREAEHYSTGAVLGNLLANRRYSTTKELIEDSVPLVEGQLEANLPEEIRDEQERRQNQFKKEIRESLETLTWREREITKMRYGIGGEHTHTLEDIERKFKVTRERVRQVEAKTMRKLQNSIRARRLGPDDFL